MRVNFVKYNKDTGEIRQWGDCEPDSAMLGPTYTEGNLLVLAGVGTHATHYVQLPELVIVEKPQQPSVYHVFNYSSKAWAMDGELAWEDIRAKRDKLLAACDWTVMPDVPLSADVKAAWLTYRQELRDVTNQGSPLGLVWPLPPN